MKTFTRPIRPKSGAVVKATDMENHARAIEEIQNAMIGDRVNVKRKGGDSKPPFWPILSGNDTEGFKLRMIKGWIVSRHLKYGVDAVLSIEVTDIPGDPDPDLDRLTVASGDKIWCKVTESEQGEASAGVVEKGTTWPESDAPKLIGGDDQTGADGTRYVRLCEIITVDGTVKVKVLHTGHIDHFAPALVENTTLSPSTNEARVYKKWNDAEGRHDLRYIEGGNGINVEELTDSVKITTDNAYIIDLFPHQWKTTLATTTTVDVLGGVFRSQAAFGQANVADVAGLAVAASGYVILTVLRDSSSREVAAAPLISYVAGEPVASDYAEQIIPLAKVTFGGGEITGILQLKYEELHVFEVEAVANGEFRLADLMIASRNIYELPP